MDWTKFNNHGESPNHAFEVMCNILFKCWLKKEYKDNISHFAFVNGSGGDGGVEAYGLLKSGDIIGVQSKWFPQKMEASQFKQIENSFYTAIKVRPELKRYIVCIPRDFTSKKMVKNNQVARDTEESKWINLCENINKEYPDGLTFKGQITRTALMLLGKKESSFYFDGFIPRITWTLYNADKSVKAYEHFDMPLLLAVDKVYGKIRNEKYRYIADQTTLFPEEVDQYNPNLVKEIINNCIAHSDYRLRGKINLEEYEDHLVFINEGAFIPETVEQALEPGYKPPYYRNAFLCNAMVNMYMIDTNSMGIPMIYEIQKGKCFPLPTFDLDTPNRVVVTVYGKVLDPNYTRLLHANDDLDLRTVFLLDQVQKKKTISKEDFSQLKSRNLVEGRYPNIFVSYKVAKVVGDKANYVRQKGLDEEVCMHFILSTLKLGPAKKSDLLAVLKDVLPDVLTDQQKSRKLSNLLQKMKKNGIIDVRGIAINSEWYLLTKD